MMNASGNDDDEPCVYLSQQVEYAMDSSDEELQDDTNNLSDEEEEISVSDLSTNALYSLFFHRIRNLASTMTINVFTKSSKRGKSIT